VNAGEQQKGRRALRCVGKDLLRPDGSLGGLSRSTREAIQVLDALGKNLHSGAEVLEEITRYKMTRDTAKIMLGNPNITDKAESEILIRFPTLVGVSRKHHFKWKLLGR
jgi:hypothetical protein